MFTFSKLRKELWLIMGAALSLLLGALFPLFFGPDNIGLPAALRRAEQSGHVNSVLIASVLLVLLNTIRAIPNYLGVLLLSEWISRTFSLKWLHWLAPILLLPSIYALINQYATIPYHFGGPAIIMMVVLILLQRVEMTLAGIGTKVAILIQILAAMQWLDVISWLTDYGFGHGAVSMRLKQLAQVNGADAGVDVFATVFVVVLLGSGIVSFALMKVLNHSARERNRVHQVQLKLAEARSGQEALFLVHDLKTPLTAISGLNSLIDMRTTDERIRLYSGKVQESVSLMNDMISEILFDERRKQVDIQELLDSVRANQSDVTEQRLTIEVRGEMPNIFVNKTRIVRALINLVNNAMDAIEQHPAGTVRLVVERTRTEVHFSVIDNGVGIGEEELPKIWQLGYSSKQSAGAGLAFVQQVVQAHQGRINVRSDPGTETAVTISLPGEGEQT